MNLYWHFLPDNGITYYNNHRVVIGKTLSIADEPVLCDQGFHASRRLIDALKYAPGSLLCRVALSGKIVEGDDKLVAQQRTVIQMADISDVLHEFACRCSEDELHIANVTDERCWNAIRVKRSWLVGKASDAELAAAWNAANAAAKDAAYAAMRAAEKGTAWAAARAASRAATRATQRNAVSDAAAAANAAAKDAARDKQNRRLTAMVARKWMV